VCKTRKKTDKGWGHPCFVKVKFTNLILFGDRKNNVHKSGLVCSVMKCTLYAHGRKHVWKQASFCFGPLLFWASIPLTQFLIECSCVNGYRGGRWRGT
jgi:hypothetical protein